MALNQEFQHFKTKYGKSYNSVEEEAYRLQVFKSKIEKAVQMNKEHNTNVFGVTKFSDLTDEEFRSTYLSTFPKVFDAPVEQPSKANKLSTSFDWRSKGVVTDVKNQGVCGSCWAHSAVETIESAWALAGNTLTEFSVQQVVSCDSSDYGCRGGWPNSAYEYVESAGGLATAASYPYTHATHYYIASSCKSFEVSGGDVSSWSYATTPCSSGSSCTSQDETTLITNLLKEPISIVVDASQWSSYTSRTFPTSSCSSAYNNLDHAVQLVGYSNYGSSSGYYIVRNSWDTNWGVDGYIYLPIGSNACGIANVATMVKVA